MVNAKLQQKVLVKDVSIAFQMKGITTVISMISFRKILRRFWFLLVLLLTVNTLKAQTRTGTTDIYTFSEWTMILPLPNTNNKLYGVFTQISVDKVRNELIIYDSKRGEKKYPIESVHVLKGETFIHYTNKCEVAPGRWEDCKSLAIISDYGANASLISGGDLTPPLIWIEQYYK